MATFYDQTNIAYWQARSRQNLQLAFENSRKRTKLNVLDRYRIGPACRERFLAVNSHSKIVWNETTCGELVKKFCDGGDGTWHRGEVLFVTLCDRQCVRSSKDELNDQDLAQIKRRLRIALRGLNHFSIVEPAYYVNWKFGSGLSGARRCISWHLHALVWGISKEKLRVRIRKLRQQGKYVALARGLKPTNIKPIEQGRLPRTVAYMLKSPSSAYRVSTIDWIRNGKVVTDADGVVEQTHSQSKSELRPGERLTVYLIMRQLCLDDLAMAGGDGKSILANVKRLTKPRQIARSRNQRARKPRRALSSPARLNH